MERGPVRCPKAQAEGQGGLGQGYGWEIRPRLPGYRDPRNFIVVSDPYPTVTAQAADLILPTAMWVEKEGAYGNAERRTQFWHQQVKAPEGAKSDLWQLMEFSKRFKVEEVWPAELIAKMPEVKGKTLFDVLYANGQVNQFPKEQSKGLLKGLAC